MHNNKRERHFSDEEEQNKKGKKKERNWKVKTEDRNETQQQTLKYLRELKENQQR